MQSREPDKLLGEEWHQAMTPHEMLEWLALRHRAAELDAERRQVTDRTNRMRQRIMQRHLYRKRAAVLAMQEAAANA